ncbi:MAG TPA: heme exporter protein CcmD [Alphaproteobacteria bacterium]|nr:heme exporter protein CcmD [Alphaproteobacteria bacterium]
MGGYALFVWPAYGLGAVALIGLLAASLRGLRRNEAAVSRLEAARPRRRKGEGNA